MNAHTSACHALLRGLPVRAPRLRWLAETLAPLGQRGFGADFVRDGTRLGIAAMLRAGITCFADLAPLPEESARVVAAARMRAAIGLPVTDAASAWAEGASGHLARAEALWDEYRSDSRITLYFAPRADVSDATLIRMRRVADELEARIALQLDELAPGRRRDAAAGTAPAGVADCAPPPRAAGAVQRLAELGLLRPGCSVIGMLCCDADELGLLTHHGASVIACPQAELRLGAAPAALVLPEGERTGLGSDSPAVAGGCDLLAEARLAALLSGGSAAQALRLATLGGASALGLASQIGSIEPGKAADLTCIDLQDSDAGQGARVANAIVFGATRSQVSDVWTAGRAAVSSGRLLHVR